MTKIIIVTYTHFLFQQNFSFWSGELYEPRTTEDTCSGLQTYLEIHHMRIRDLHQTLEVHSIVIPQQI